MDISLIPARPGQVCKIVSEVPDLEQQEVYIVAEDPADFDNADEIMVVSLTELQRNVSNPDKAERIGVQKDQLAVIAADLEAYVLSWNDRIEEQ